jgi:hypothetical protein
VATSGQTITRVRITGAPGDCIRVVGVTDVVIHDVQLEGCGGHAIRIDQAARIRVSNSLLVPRRTKTTLDSQHGVFATACADVLVQGNILRDFETGVEAMDCQSVTVKGNYSENPKGPFPRGQHVQFWRCNQNGPLERGCVADRNYYANTETEVHNGGAGQEDAINVGHSAHARITDNYLIGGRAASGCGVAFESAAHIYVARNVMVRTSQCGFNASNAAFALVEENKVLDTNLPSLSTGNIGLGAFYKTGQTGCHDNLYRNNVVSNLLPSGGYNDIWLKSGCGTQTNNTKGDAARALLLPEAEKLPPPPIPPLPWVP